MYKCEKNAKGNLNIRLKFIANKTLKSAYNLLSLFLFTIVCRIIYKLHARFSGMFSGDKFVDL